MNKKNNNENNNEIEVIIGDDSELNISEVGDCMNDLRPKTQKKEKKDVIIPNIKNKKNSNSEIQENKNANEE